MNTTITYGSMGGVTEEVSERLGRIMDAKVVNIADVKEETFSDGELFILATSTWGSGDLTDDWDLGLKKLKQFGLDGKFIGLAIDEDNQDKLTETRLKTWFEQLKVEMA